MIAHFIRSSTLLLVVLTFGAGRIAAQEDYLRGDANSDGEVTISDAQALFLHRLRGLGLPDCRDAQDVNSNGAIDLADAIFVLVYLFREGPPPPEPFPDPDSEPSDLGCLEYGAESPLEDREAQLVVLSAEVGSGRASIVLGASYSSPIGGFSFSLRLPAEIVTHEPPLVYDLTGASTDPFVSGRWEGDGTYTHGFFPSIAPPPSIPESLEVVPICRLAVCLQQGTPAGEYPVELVDGEFADAESGRAIKPTLVGGTLRLDADLNHTGDCSPPAETSAYGFQFEFGQYVPESPELQLPTVAVDSSGRFILGTWLSPHGLFLYDSGGRFISRIPLGSATSHLAVDRSDRIIRSSTNLTEVYDPDGHFLFGVGTGGKFTIDSEDRIIDPDEENHRVQVFDRDGALLFEFGEPGSEDGQFDFAVARSDVAVDRQDRIFVGDSRNQRTQVFDSEGQFLFKFGDGENFILDSLDRLVLTRGNFIQVLDLQGQFLFQLGGTGFGDGEFSKLSGATVDRSGRIIVADDYPNLRVQVFDEDGAFDFNFGTEGLGEGQFLSARDAHSRFLKVWTDDMDRIIVTQNPPGRAQVFNPDGDFLFELGREERQDGELSYPESVAVDSSGRIVVAADNRIHVFDAEAEFLFKFGRAGSGDGEFWGHTGVATDSRDRIIVADASNHRVQVFDPDGTFLFQFGRDGTGDGEFWYARDVAVDIDDRIIVIDSRPGIQGLVLIPGLDDENNRVQVFDAEGNFLFKFGGAGSDDGQFRAAPESVAVDRLDRILVAAPFPDFFVHVFDSTGEFLFKFGGQGKLNPRGVAVDSRNRIFVVDDGVKVFDSEGALIGEFADRRSVGSGVLDDDPRDVAVDNDDRIVVADTRGHRMVVYARLGGLLPGDCNSDGNLDLADGVCLLHYLFEPDPPELPCGNGTLENSGNTRLLDSNGDRVVNISDGVAILSFLFSGGPAPVLGTDCVAMGECPQVCGP